MSQSKKKETHRKYRTNNRRLDDTPKKQALQARIAAGSSLSVVSTSLLNRFSTRPSGVMSKNVVSGARSTFRSSRWCRIRDALRAPTYRASVVNRTVTTVSHRQHTNTQRRNYARKGRRDMVWYTDIYKRREDYPKKICFFFMDFTTRDYIYNSEERMLSTEARWTPMKA